MTVERCWSRGIRHFDTAPFYGFGLSERRPGDALRGRPRNDYVLSTKVGGRGAAIYTLIQTARLNFVDPEAWLRDMLTRVADGYAPCKVITENGVLEWRGDLSSMQACELHLPQPA